MTSRFDLPSDSSLSGPLVRRLQQDLIRIQVVQPTSLRQIGMALHEALVNAIEHGNLEVPSALKEDGDAFQKMIAQRSTQLPYSTRRVRVTAHHSLQAGQCEVKYVIADEGPGFNWADLPDPTDPANLEKPSGRGLLLIHTFMDEVTFNSAGNEVTLIRRLASD